jgi:PAS domain S-box-containing protein
MFVPINSKGWRRTALIALFCAGATLPASTKTSPKARPERQQTEVLFLSSLDPDLSDVDALIEEAETQILEGRDTPVHFSHEYDPSLSSEDSSRQARAFSLLKEKRRGQVFDLVITIGGTPGALEELSHARLFPEATLLFFVVNPEETTHGFKLPPNSTGVVRSLNYLPTLQLALRENPGTRRVVVVAGSSDTEKLEVKMARQQFGSYESGIDFQYWTDLKFAELRSRLAQVEPDTVVLILNFLEDAAGERFTPARVLRTVAKTANRPMYGTFLSFVGNGVVGGHVVDLRGVGRILGQDGVRILNGEKPGHIPVETHEFERDVFDWRELRRWGIPQDQLPPGSSVLYWEASPWEFYRWRILGLVALVLVETLLIVMLLRNRASRKAAEDSLRRKDEALLEAQRMAELGSWQWNPKTDAVTWSDPLCAFFGLDPGLPMPPFKELARYFTVGSWQQLTESMDKALCSGETYQLELEGFRADGTRICVAARGEAVRDVNGDVVQLRGTMQNITERKMAEEARLKHAAIVESSDDAIISKDLNGIIRSWNLAAERMFGFTEAEAVGKPVTTIIPAELQDEDKTIMQRVRGGERVEHYETVRVSKEGRQIHVSLTVSPLRDSTGRIVGASKIARDITERKQAEQQLRSSEERFSKAFRQGPMAVTITTVENHRYIDVSETFEQLTGYRREELIGRSALEVGAWVEPKERVKLIKKLLAEGHLRDWEFQFRTKDGQLRVARGSAELIEIGGERCVLSAAIDVTDRKQAELAVVESEGRFRLMADSAPVLMWLSGPDKLCTDFNQGWLTFTGRTLEQELGDGWSQGVHPDDLEHCLEAYGRAFDVKESFAIEYRLRRHDGQYRWLLDRGVPRFLENGDFAGFIGCCIDITDEKEAKAARAEFGSRLIQAQEEERARIARELHDDINQRLALVANGLQEVVRTRHELRQTKELRELWQLTSEIAADVQDLSHQLHPSKLHYLGLAAAVRGLCQEFSRQHKIEVECVVRDLPKDLDESISLSLFRTIQESLHNVAKHSQAHHVKVELIRQSSVVRLRVSDDGVGFNPDYAAKNHGLGLVSMRERLRSAGGELFIWSRPSLGTQVEGTVPAASRHARSA